MSKTHFGFESVDTSEKSRRVRGVFDSVANRYDLMNDLMSGGLHRAWKRFAVAVSGVRAGSRVLDLAGGTGDLARLFATAAGPTGSVVLNGTANPVLVGGYAPPLNSTFQVITAPHTGDYSTVTNTFGSDVTNPAFVRLV